MISNFLINKAYVTENPKIKDFCITKLANFLHDQQNVKLVISWILDYDFEVMMPRDLGEHTEPVYDSEDLTSMDLTMTEHHKYYLTKVVSGSPFISETTRMALWAKVYRNDTTDSTIKFRMMS